LPGKDYYKILEVHPEASVEVIKKAYQTLALRYHPDKHNPGRKKWAEEKFKELSGAYQILSDPTKRRDYDRSGYSEEVLKKAGTTSTRDDEEAYFYYRMGLRHYKRVQRKRAWRILSGIAQSDLKKAQDDFITVLDEYPNSRYTEDAHFYYLRTLMESYKYDQEFLKDTEEEFTEFFDEYPRSKWGSEAKMHFAKFYLFKKRDLAKVKELLNEVIRLYSNTGLSQEAEILLDHTQKLNKNLALHKRKKSV